MLRVFVLLSLLGVCEAVQAGVPTGSKLPELLAQAERLWKAKGPRSYRYTIAKDCPLCAPPVEVIVVNGKCVSARPSSTWPEITCKGRTIPELFRDIRAWVEDTSGSTIEVAFDKRYGYPVTSFIQTNMEHDTERYTVKKFRVSK